MKIDEINDMLYYLGEKYDFDPLEYKINLLTGIVTPRRSGHDLESERVEHDLRAGSRPQVSQIVRHTAREPGEMAADVDEPPSNRVVEIEDSVDGIRTYRIYAENVKAEYMGARPVLPAASISDLDAWIRENDLTYLEARKMVSSLELKDRMSEISPNSAGVVGSGLLSEFEDWIRFRGLNYFKVRMMIAELGQEEEQERLESLKA